MAKKVETKRFGNPLYKCRLCGEIYCYPIPSAVPIISIREWDIQYDERIALNKEICRLAGIEYEPVESLPEKYHTHTCKDGRIGISDCIGFANIQLYTKYGKYWREPKEKK